MTTVYKHVFLRRILYPIRAIHEHFVAYLLTHHLLVVRLHLCQQVKLSSPLQNFFVNEVGSYQYLIYQMTIHSQRVIKFFFAVVSSLNFSTTKIPKSFPLTLKPRERS